MSHIETSQNSAATQRIPSVLCIAGLDPSGGAGLLADARACLGAGVHALGVATALTAQNTRGVARVEAVSPAMLRAQIETLLEDVRPGAIKIGLIPNLELIELLAEILRPLAEQLPIVIDTVFAPTTGAIFSDDHAIEAMRTQLLPLALVVTPNALEAVQLGAAPITEAASMERAAREVLARTGARSVLLKGGHLSDAEFSTDLFFDGSHHLELRARRESGYEVRGTGCLLASSLAAHLALGKSPRDAASAAKSWLTREFGRAQVVGGGRRVAAIPLP